MLATHPPSFVVSLLSSHLPGSHPRPPHCSIMICGMMMKHYAAKNIHKTSRIGCVPASLIDCTARFLPRIASFCHHTHTRARVQLGVIAVSFDSSVYYFLKMIAGTAETLVFLLLGVEVVTSISDGTEDTRTQQSLRPGKSRKTRLAAA